MLTQQRQQTRTTASHWDYSLHHRLKADVHYASRYSGSGVDRNTGYGQDSDSKYGQVRRNGLTLSMLSSHARVFLPAGWPWVEHYVARLLCMLVAAAWHAADVEAR